MELPSDLKISISGIRGLAPGPLTPDVAYRFARAFARIMGEGAIVVGQDSRPSGRGLLEAAVQGFEAEGRTVINVGLAPLPTVQVAVESMKAAGGLDVTASHNPVQWNGLKFLSSDGTFLQQTAVDALKDAYVQIVGEPQELDTALPADFQEQAYAAHMDLLLPLACAGRPLTVAVDAVNGSGSYLIPRFLEKLGCTVIPIACDPEQPFPHTPEPIPANLEWTRNQLEGLKFDLVAIVDPDADRLVLADENGRLLSEEALMPLAAMEVCLAGQRGPVVINMSSSAMIDQVVAPYGCPVVRCPVGEINVVNAMRREKAILGGEGCGGAIDPRLHYGRDSMVALLYTINLMRRTGKSLATLADELPRLTMEKRVVGVPAGAVLSDIYAKVEQALQPEFSDHSDGLYLRWPDRWLHLRPSNTEPIVRLIGEAGTPEALHEMLMSAQTAAGIQ